MKKLTVFLLHPPNHEAYEVLFDDDKRRIYDTQGKAGLDRANRQGGGGGHDMFSQMFGFGRQQNKEDQRSSVHPPSLLLPFLAYFHSLFLYYFSDIEDQM